MKAAVIHAFGQTPVYEDFADPIPQEGEVMIQVKAVPLENIDRAMVRGSHFASRQFLSHLPAIVGFDGIGLTDDNRLVGFGGMRPPFGAMAERVIVPATHTVPIPAGVAAETAAAVPGSALTGLFPLKWGAQLQAGETVLINGATGFTGRLAVQIAKLLGAGRVVGSGRHAQSLEQLKALGADAVIDLTQPEEAIIEAFKREGAYHVVLDFLWGRPTELLLQSLAPQELSLARQSTRLVQLGEMADARISLSADAIRTSGLEIISGVKNLTPESMAAGTGMVWQWLHEGKLQADIEPVALKDVESAWRRTDLHGKRIVIVP